MTDEPVALARRILRYMESRPAAKESLEGISEWWLLRERIEESVEHVSQAITWMVSNGYLLEKKISGAKTLYEINPSKRGEIVAFLRDFEDEDPEV